MGRAVLKGWVIAAALFGAGSASANVTVFGDSFAATCSRYAKAGRMDLAALEVCSVALSEATLSRRDHAATYVNRATMHLHRREWTNALADLNAALGIDPSVGETRVNRGAVYIALDRPRDAIVEIDAGLQLGSDELEKAYFNRAMAHEMLDDVKAAYFDYLKAAELAPTWGEPKEALTRFKVSAR